MEEALLERVGARVRALRATRGLTRKELAEAAELSLRFVAQLEAGQANISIARLARLAGALGASLSSLVEEQDGLAPGLQARLGRLLRGRSPAELERGLQALAEAWQEGSQPWFLALLGLRGAGKSTLGPQVARALGLPFVELDERIEAQAGLSLTEIFSLHGEAYYRRLEGQCIQRLISAGLPSVVALPGGIVHNPEAFALVRRHATSLWLEALPEDHMSRVLAQGDQRPMAQRQDAMAELRALLATREPLYRQADLHLNTSTQGEGSLATLLGLLSALPWISARGAGGLPPRPS